MKSPEEAAAEREEAQKQLEQLLAGSRPKNLQQGLSSGVSNIVAGAVGAAGVAVILPVAGLGVGLRGGGLIGGALGAAVGGVAGALGAAALAIGGVVGGVMQITRGIAAVPESIIAPRSGKWWNETVGQWILTNMDNEKKELQNIPEDDSDLLKPFADDIDASAKATGSSEVLDMYYYDILEIPASAEPSLIKRRYYVLARQHHPDKVGANNKEAADKFKDIAEAYQVLSDPELRKKYDQEGRSGLSPDKTSVADTPTKMDPYLLFAFLFGSDKFHNYVGRLSTATSASVGDSPKVSMDDARKLQHRRVTRMALYLIEKITPWVESTGSRDDIEATWLSEAIELSHASFGYQMVTTIGKIYNMLAVVYEGSSESGNGLTRLSKWAAKNKASMDARNDASKNKLNAMMATVDMMKMKLEYQKKMELASTDEERSVLMTEMEDAAAALMVRILWTTTVVDISAAIYEATQMSFFDQSVTKEVRKERAMAIKKIGDIWMNVPDEADTSTKSMTGQPKNAKQLYEEAAFAAMVETVKRKDDEGSKHADS